MMKLYKETGTNPLASCLPILLQAPIFFALFSVLQGVAMYNPDDPEYVAPGVFPWPQYAGLAESMHDARDLRGPAVRARSWTPTRRPTRWPPGSWRSS